MSVSHICRVGSSLCDKLITHSQESYQVGPVCDLEISIMRQPKPDMGCCTTKNNWIYTLTKNIKLKK